MNIEKVKHEVLNNNLAIEYDNGNLEKLNKVLKFIFPKDTTVENYVKKTYFYKDLNSKIHLWNFKDSFNSNTIPLSQITFDEQPTINDVIELRRQFPSDWDFAQKFDELTKNLK